MHMNQQRNIGDQIRDAVQDAIANQDYTALRKTVEQGINAATETIGRSLASAQQNVQQRAAASEAQRQQEMQRRSQAAMVQQQRQQAAMARRQQQQALAAVSWRFSKGGSTKAAGVGLAIGGAVLSLGFAGGAVATLIGAAVATSGFVPVSVVMLACLAGSVGMLVAGARKIGFADRFRSYRRLLGTCQACSVAELQKATGQSRAAVVKDLNRMIARGMFTQGHLSADDEQLMVTDEAYAHYLELERAKAEQARVRRLTRDADAAPDGPVRLSAEQQALLSKGEAYVVRIRAINDRIPDPEITRKIRQIEMVVQKIFDYAAQHPEVIDDLQRLMDYYLPTTVKLLDAYADLDAQPVQGDNITSAKHEIEETLDTLSVAFERLLDSIFKDMTWDVSTDISVLHTVLAQEGLAPGAFEGKEPR